MSPPIITFFNNKGGVGKTSLVYHTAWKAAGMGLKVLCADLDPQANLTSNFIDDDNLIDLWEGSSVNSTIYNCIVPIKDGTGDINVPNLYEIDSNLKLIPGDLRLSLFEDELSAQWPDCLDGKPRGFRVISSFYRVVAEAAIDFGADLVLIDVGPNLGAINRAAIVSSDWVIMPLAPDLFSLQGLRNLGPTLRRWRQDWEKRVPENPDKSILLPKGKMQPLGYIVMQHSEVLTRPVKAYRIWIERIPEVFWTDVLDNSRESFSVSEAEKYRIANLKHYRSLMPYAQEARKPMFHLKPADGAIGGHQELVKKVGEAFRELTESILSRIKQATPPQLDLE